MGAALKSEIKRWLVRDAEEILERIKDKKAEFKDQTSQLRNLVQIVQEESEIAVLRNFIRYQTGRKTTRGFWLLIHESLIGVLNRIEKEPDLKDEALRRAAIQQFFGYLVRHYVYLEALRKEKEDEENRQRRQSAGGRR